MHILHQLNIYTTLYIQFMNYSLKGEDAYNASANSQVLKYSYVAVSCINFCEYVQYKKSWFGFWPRIVCPKIENYYKQCPDLLYSSWAEKLLVWRRDREIQNLYLYFRPLTLTNLLSEFHNISYNRSQDFLLKYTLTRLFEFTMERSEFIVFW